MIRSVSFFKHTGAILLLLFFFSDLFSQQTIREVKSLPLGSVVTILGITSTGPEYGVIRYIQDQTAGIALYSTSLSGVEMGDRLEVTGVLSNYNGQLQISPVLSFEVITTGTDLMVPLRVNLDDPDLYLYESRIVYLSCAGISTCKDNFESGWFTAFDKNGQSIKWYLEETNFNIGKTIPSKPIYAAGILVYQNDQYHLLLQYYFPSFENDCFVIDRGDIISNASEFTTVLWNVVDTGSFTIQYGIELFDREEAVTVSNGTIEYTFDDLQQGQIYIARIRQIIESDTIYSFPTFLAAKGVEDPAVELFFNRNVNTSFSDGSHPAATGPSVIETDIIARINTVQSTLDVAMYNTTNSNIVQAIENAADRGVDVRYIADDETSNTALQGTLPFDVLFRTGDGIMHHKFIIADAEIPGKAWLWTGSTNFSSNQLSSDPNHAYIFNEQSLAQNYKREFDELWGTNTTHDYNRLGQEKLDNTAHQFLFGETLIESYFSPSDETGCHIMQALASADHHIEIGLLLLTKEDLVDQIITLHNSGILIRVIVEDEESSSQALTRLRNAGVPTRVHEFSSIFHHKYAIIDEGYPDSDPIVITGSHNWTWSADNINDENTLIVHNQSFANVFRQEFEARWAELQSTSINDFTENNIITIKPNPASDFIELENPFSENCTLVVLDATGSRVQSIQISAEAKSKLDLDDYTNGLYFIRWTCQNQQATSRFVIKR